MRKKRPQAPRLITPDYIHNHTNLTREEIESRPLIGIVRYIHNHTNLTREEIESRPLIGIVRNNWRRRRVSLYQAEDTQHVYCVGVAYEGPMVVLSREEIGMDFAAAIDYWKQGNKVYIRD